MVASMQPSDEQPRVEAGPISSWLVAWGDFLDFGWMRSRRHIAKVLTAFATAYRNSPSDDRPLRKIERAAESRRRFTRCYALDTLGRLGEFAWRTVRTQADALSSSDPFVREAAARSLCRMGGSAYEAKEQLKEVIYRWPGEGTSRYALMWMVRGSVPNNEIWPILDFLLSAKDSYPREEAAFLAERLDETPRSDLVPFFTL